MEYVGIFYDHFIYCGHLVYFVAIWYTSRLFGTFSRFGMLYQEKSGNPAYNVDERNEMSVKEKKDSVSCFSLSYIHKTSTYVCTYIGTCLRNI
jgi:hypothetical protein